MIFRKFITGERVLPSFCRDDSVSLRTSIQPIFKLDNKVHAFVEDGDDEHGQIGSYNSKNIVMLTADQAHVGIQIINGFVVSLAFGQSDDALF